MSSDVCFVRLVMELLSYGDEHEFGPNDFLRSSATNAVNKIQANLSLKQKHKICKTPANLRTVCQQAYCHLILANSSLLLLLSLHFAIDFFLTNRGLTVYYNL